MVTGQRAAQVERKVLDLASSGLGSVPLRLAVLDALSAAVPFEGAFLPTADPGTLLYTGAVRRGLPGDVTPSFLANEFGRPDVNKFRVLVTSGRRVSTLDAATAGAWSGSARYRELLRPMGFGDELRAVFGTGRSTWGYACLHRGPGAPFAPSEVRLVERIAPHVGEGLRQAALRERAARDGVDAPGVLTLTPDLTMVSATQAALAWLEELAHAEHPRPSSLPLAVLAVATRLRRGQGPARLTAQAASGRWLTLHASRLAVSDDDRAQEISVVIEAASPDQLEPAVAAAYRLTPRESEALRLLLQGLATKQVATALGVSVHTANDYVKAVYDKTGVSSRGQLLSAVFHTQTTATG